MGNKMNGVKISVKNDDTEGASRKKPNKKPVSRQPKKKAANSKPAAKIKPSETAKGQPAVKKEPIKNSASTAQRGKGGLVNILVSVGLTTLIVGGGVYAWQQKTTTKDVEGVRKDARENRISFEQRLDDIKNKLTGAESENVELKKQKEELAVKAQILNEAKLEFMDEYLGLKFSYPAAFGKVNLDIIDGKDGKKFLGTFELNDKFMFGGTSADYVPNATSTDYKFMETQGFADERNAYYFLPTGSSQNRDYKLAPAKVIGRSGGEALLLDANSFAEPGEDTPEVGIAQNIGLLANLEGDEFSGVAWINMDLGMLPLDDFEALAKSIETDF